MAQPRLPPPRNFPISDLHFSRAFLRALGLIKLCAAQVNEELGLLDTDKSRLIQAAAQEVADGQWDAEFPIDVFQTGSATSTNMNANEVIASRAREMAPSVKIHPNDDVNMGQSSNDVIPATIHVAAYLDVAENLLPALAHLEETLRRRAQDTHDVIKTGRTHLMDAMPIRLGQQVGGWATQIVHAQERIKATLPPWRNWLLAAPLLARASTPIRSLASASPPLWPKRPACPSSRPTTTLRPRPPRTRLLNSAVS